MTHPLSLLAALLLATAAVTFAPVPRVAPPPFADASLPVGAPQAPRARGLKVTFEPIDGGRKAKEGAHSRRMRLLAVAVDRGESPTPMLSPGMFRATFEGVLPLPVRDRYRFRVSGKGSAELKVGGATVLSGSLRPGRVLETEKGIRLDKGDNAIVCRFESTAIGDGQLRVEWSSSDFAWEPIAPELWQWPADDAEIAAGELLQHGQQAFVRGLCVRCHELDQPLESAYDELSGRAPDLRTVGARVHSGFLVEWLLDPRAVRADASMPRMRLQSEQEAHDVAAWLATLGQPLQDPTFDTADAERGATRFLELGCVACHPRRADAVAPVGLPERLPLGYVPRKWRAAALVQWLREPQADHPTTTMPDFRLEPDDAKVLTAYLLQGAQPPAPAKGSAERGRKIAQQHGCDRCHDLDLPETGPRFRELRGLHAEHGCIEGAAGAPDYGFDERTRAALRAFVPRALEAVKRRSPLDYAARWVKALRCTNCHGRDGEASVWARVAAAMAKDEPLPVEQDPVAQGVPALTWVGGKLQPGWMERFVTGRGTSPRPWLRARMPAFVRHGGTVVQGIVREHGYLAQDEPEQGPDAQLAAHGERLVRMGEGFGCVQCHGVAGKPPVQVFERQGIDFAVAAERLRKEYYMRWLLDPPRIDPDSRMPKFADAKGRTAFTDVLGGDAAKQFDAIWHWFRTLR